MIYYNTSYERIDGSPFCTENPRKPASEASVKGLYRHLRFD